MSNLRAKIIRLAHSTPALRPVLLPLLKEAAGNSFSPGDPAMWNGKKVLVVDVHGYGERQTADLRWTISGVSGSKDEVSGHKRLVPVNELEKLGR